MNRRDFIRTISLTLGAVGLESTSFNVENLGFAEDKPGRKILYFDLSTEWEHPPTVDEADGTSKAAKIVKKLGEAIGYDVDCTAVMDGRTVAAVKEFQRSVGGYPYACLDYNTMKNLDNAFNHWLSGGDEDFALEEAINYLEKTGTEDAA